MTWDASDPAWQYELLDKLPKGVDEVQLDRWLKLTVTERFELVRQLADLAEELRRSRDRLPSTVRAP